MNGGGFERSVEELISNVSSGIVKFVMDTDKENRISKRTHLKFKSSDVRPFFVCVFFTPKKRTIKCKKSGENVHRKWPTMFHHETYTIQNI